MVQPLVSVICACYNQSKFVIESLESVKNQTYQNLEIIIWDDASSDDSAVKIDDWIKNNSELNTQFIKNKINLGICKSLNIAQNLTTGKYIQILALDDTLFPDKITRHVDILEKSKENEALVFTDAILMNDDSELYQNRFIAFHKKYLSLATGYYFDDLIQGNFIPAMSILYKSSDLKNMGPWDEELSFEDYDMLLRLGKKYDFIFDPEVSVTYRLHENNTHTKLRNSMQKSLFNIYLKYINYNKTVNFFLLSRITALYLKNELVDEHIKYFIINKPRTLKEKWIAENRSVKLYNYIDKLIRIKNIVLYR